MAEGIRIRHNVRRSQMLPVPLLFEPWPTNRAECGVCHTIHPCKVIHLTLDDTGAVIVSKEVKAKIWRVPTNGGFRVVNPVANPPAQGITPDTVKLKVEAVEIGGGLQAAEPNRRYATVAAEDPPATRTVDLEEYVTVAQRHGINIGTALNVLLANILGLGETSQEGRDERQDIAS